MTRQLKRHNERSSRVRVEIILLLFVNGQRELWLPTPLHAFGDLDSFFVKRHSQRGNNRQDVFFSG
jgi:hypothetical protein